MVGLPDHQDNEVDLILKHNADEAVIPQAYGKVPKHAKITETNIFGTRVMGEIQFDNTGYDDKNHDDT